MLKPLHLLTLTLWYCLHVSFRFETDTFHRVRRVHIQYTIEDTYEEHLEMP